MTLKSVLMSKSVILYMQSKVLYYGMFVAFNRQLIHIHGVSASPLRNGVSYLARYSIKLWYVRCQIIPITTTKSCGIKQRGTQLSAEVCQSVPLLWKVDPSFWRKPICEILKIFLKQAEVCFIRVISSLSCLSRFFCCCVFWKHKIPAVVWIYS